MTVIFLSLCILYLVLEVLWKPQTRLPKGTRDAVRAIIVFIAIQQLGNAVGSMTWDRKVGEFHSISFWQGELQPVYSPGAPHNLVIEYNQRSWWGLKNAGKSIAEPEGIGFRYTDGATGEWHKVPSEVVGQANAVGQTLW